LKGTGGVKAPTAYLFIKKESCTTKKQRKARQLCLRLVQDIKKCRKKRNISVKQ
jgi:hypothetical protein